MSTAKAEKLLDEAKRLAVRYRTLTGRPLGITSEVGELEVARRLRLKLSPPRTAGHDAKDARGRRVQIKARVGGRGRIGRVSRSGSCDLIVLVVFDSDYQTLGIWQAKYAAVQVALDVPGSRARNELRALSVSAFKKIAGPPIWSPK